MNRRNKYVIRKIMALMLSGVIVFSSGCGVNNSGKAAGDKPLESADKADTAGETSNDSPNNIIADDENNGSSNNNEESNNAGNNPLEDDSENDNSTNGDASKENIPTDSALNDESSHELTDEDLKATLDYTYQSHPMTLKNGDTDYASANYYTVKLDKNVINEFDKLQKTLDAFGAEGEKETNEFFSSSAPEIKEMFESEWNIPYEVALNYYPIRADGKVFSFVVEDYAFLGGAHGYTYFKDYNFDPVTGKEIAFSDVVKNTETLPEIIANEIEKQNEDIAKDFRGYPDDRNNFISSFPDRLKENAKALSWALDYDGVVFCFEDYAMGSYALGWQMVKVKFKDYPEIFTDTYDNYDESEMPDINEIGKELKETDTVTVDATPFLTDITDNKGKFPGGLDDDGKGEDEEYGEDWWYHAVVKNPGWTSFTADGIDTEAGKPSYELSEISSNTTDWLNEETWAKEKGIPLPERFPYSDETYSYSVVNDADNGELSLTVFNNELGSLEGNYYFDEFLNPPDQGDGLFADVTTPYIYYAKIKDNILYVSLGHRTYASANPHKSYMVAIDMVSGETLWKSDDQVCSSYNFVILGDSIYCGYGFTQEPDYIYVLNIKNGKVQQKINVKSAPYYFIVQEETMYVLTYNTEYLYKIVD
ncbi:DUF3298 and DUF4163 domain-containing protein [Butyrivibrio sp. LC3010]|uniref:DUF3298 and DUF4163 domain-containing protein n=1 Tax=Butyrivibrio sp. LC3010 TaxID=1280680 RepID=UPI0004071781|nr:DUF4163 domain-containing protein [Butyrivibrio sp. LC3010]